MSKGGFRPNSGRKKGSIPWNKGLHSGNHGNGFKKGKPAWNKGLLQPKTAKRMLGNQNGKGNKGRIMDKEWIKKLRLAKLGKPSPLKGRSIKEDHKDKISSGRRQYLLTIDPNYDYRLDSRTRAGNKRIRRERIKRFGGSHSKEEWESLKEKYGFACPSCKRKEPEIKLTRDHILSLSNKGTDDISNIQPLCIQCNSKKFTKTIRY